MANKPKSIGTHNLTCRICDCLDFHQTFQVREMMFGTRKEYEYFQCNSCGCLQITNIPTNPSSFYPDNYYSLQKSDKPPRHKFIPLTRRYLEHLRVNMALFGKGQNLNSFAKLFVDLPPEIHPAGPFLKDCGVKSWNCSFLDVGCGSRSWWLSNLQALGFKNLVGVDPHIEEDFNDDGIRISKKHIQDIRGKFDVITLHHSLEHIPNQIDTLLTVKSLLKSTGCCLIRIPIVSSLVWELYSTDWVELDAPRHLYLHSLKSIELLGKKVGLELFKTTWDSGAFGFYGSEQYRRDIPLIAENSFWRDPTLSDFTYREMAEYTALAAKANQEGSAGRGCFFFRSANH